MQVEQCRPSLLDLGTKLRIIVEQDEIVLLRTGLLTDESVFRRFALSALRNVERRSLGAGVDANAARINANRQVFGEVTGAVMAIQDGPVTVEALVFIFDDPNSSAGFLSLLISSAPFNLVPIKTTVRDLDDIALANRR